MDRYICYLFTCKNFSNIISESFEEEKLLTPIMDTGNMGGLVPVSSLDQTLDDMIATLPNYLNVSLHSNLE